MKYVGSFTRSTLPLAHEHPPTACTQWPSLAFESVIMSQSWIRAASSTPVPSPLYTLQAGALPQVTLYSLALLIFTRATAKNGPFKQAKTEPGKSGCREMLTRCFVLSTSDAQSLHSVYRRRLEREARPRVSRGVGTTDKEATASVDSCNSTNSVFSPKTRKERNRLRSELVCSVRYCTAAFYVHRPFSPNVSPLTSLSRPHGCSHRPNSFHVP